MQKCDIANSHAIFRRSRLRLELRRLLRLSSGLAGDWYNRGNGPADRRRALRGVTIKSFYQPGAAMPTPGSPSMSRCSICRPERVSLDVSLLQNGTRFTARQYGLSRSALDRHRRHVLPTVPNEDREAGAGNSETQALLLKVDVIIRDCEQALAQARADSDSSALVKLMRELRANVALKSTENESKELLRDAGADLDYSVASWMVQNAG